MIEGMVESGADLVASVPADFFSDVTPETPVDTSASSSDNGNEGIDAPGDFESMEKLAPGEIPDELAEDSAPVEDDKPVVPAKVDPAKPAEELPDGVTRGKDRNGKEGLWVKPDRWETIHGNHKMVQEVSQLLGEPVTVPALELREQAYQSQQMLANDINSGDPAAQSRVVNYFLDQMNGARAAGEIGIDATVPFAQAVYTAMKEKSPDGFANFRLMSARDLAGELFETAARSGDADLFTSVQHVVRALTGVSKGTDSAGVRAIAERMGIPFHAKAEMDNLARGADPVTTLRQRNAELEAQLNGRTSTTQAAQLAEWKQQTWQSMEQGVIDDVVQPALASVEEAWKPYPAEYKTHVVDALHSKVDSILRADPALKNRITALQNRARLATSAQVRSQLAAEIRTAYVNRAKLATEASLRPVLDSANKILTGLSNSNHERRQSAQGRTAPTRGAQGSVQRSIRPDLAMPNGTFDPSFAVKQAISLR